MQPPSIETRTLAEQIADRLREDVLSGRLPAGSRLSQEALAERYAVSRVPIRDALRTLHGEGLITTHPRFGTTVAPLSIPDLEELYEMRVALEPVVSRLATPRLAPADLQAMRRHLDEMAAARQPSGDWFVAHAAFHRALNAPSGRGRMLALVESLRAQTERYLRVFQMLEGPGAHALDTEHELIYRTAEQGDPDEVAEAVREHLSIVRDRMLDHLREEETA